MIKVVKKSKDSIALLIIEVGNGWGDFPLRQPIHILSKPYPWDSYSRVGVIRMGVYDSENLAQT
jgi:hypothetical protein